MGHESRLDGTVDYGLIGVGEEVTVTTRMGVPVAEGIVVGRSPLGLVIGQSYNGARNQTNYFEGNLYLFRVKEPVIPDSSALDEGDLDSRVEAKLRAISEADKLKDGAGKAATGAVADPDGSVDVDKLPADIKKSILSANQMDLDTLNGVMSEIGDAAVKALKRASVKETEIYEIAAKIQKVVHEVLTKKGGK